MPRLSSAFAALAAVSLAALVGFLLQREAPDLVYAAPSDARGSSSSSSTEEITRPLPGFEARLQAALRFKTVSTLSTPTHLERPQEMLALHAHLQKSFPLTWGALKPTFVNEFSLLFEWEGSDREAAPGLLISHLDVVPAAEDDDDDEESGGNEAATPTKASWASAGGGPFDGVLTDKRGGKNEDDDGSYFVGRGSLDVKGGALAILEAVEALLSSPSSSSSSNSSSSFARPFSPRRTLFIALGHDEEVGGSLGARAMAREIESRLLQRRRGGGLSSSPSSLSPPPTSSSEIQNQKRRPPPPPQLAFALDEGGVVLPAGLPPLLNVPVAAVATAEKGYASLKLTVKGSGGHSAMPPLAAAATAASALARAAAAADSGRPRPRLVRPTTDMLRAAGSASGVRGARLAAAAIAWLAEAGERGKGGKSCCSLPPSPRVFFSSLARAFTSRIALAAARASPPPVAAQLATTVAITRLETALGGGEEDSEGEKRSANEETPAAAEKKKKKKTAKTAAAADNVIPPFASMTLNYRPLPGDDAGVVPMEHLRRAAAAAGLAFDDVDGGSSSGDKEKTKGKRKNLNPPVTASVSALRIEQASAVTPADSKPMQALRRALARSGMPRERGMAVVVREIFRFGFFFRVLGFFFFPPPSTSTEKRRRKEPSFSISHARLSFSLSLYFNQNTARAPRRGHGQQGLPIPPLFSVAEIIVVALSLVFFFFFFFFFNFKPRRPPQRARKQSHPPLPALRDEHGRPPQGARFGGEAAEEELRGGGGVLRRFHQGGGRGGRGFVKKKSLLWEVGKNFSGAFFSLSLAPLSSLSLSLPTSFFCLFLIDLPPPRSRFSKQAIMSSTLRASTPMRTVSCSSRVLSPRKLSKQLAAREKGMQVSGSDCRPLPSRLFLSPLSRRSRSSTMKGKNVRSIAQPSSFSTAPSTQPQVAPARRSVSVRAAVKQVRRGGVGLGS